MFCLQCGLKLDTDSKFCGSCGSRVLDHSTTQTNIAPEKTDLKWEHLVSAAKSLQMRINKAGGKYSETLEIAPKGYLIMPNQGDDVGSLFAAFGSQSSESLVSLAQKIKEHFPGFSFSFENDPQGKWIKYTVTGGNEGALSMLCSRCGSELDRDAKYCSSCGRSTSEIKSIPEQKPVVVTKQVDAGGKKTYPPSIEGWLALLCFGLVVSTFIVGFELLSNVSGLVKTIDLILFALLLCILYLMYKHDHRFSRFVVIYLSVQAAIGLFAAIGTNGQDSSVFRSIIVAAIWIPYVLVSKRVKATFIS